MSILIVAGALEKEVVLHPVSRNVARRLVREAIVRSCFSPSPESEPKPLRKIVFMADYSEQARARFAKTFHLAAAEKMRTSLRDSRLHDVR